MTEATESSPPPPAVEVRGLRRSFVTKRDALGRPVERTQAVDGVDLVVPAGSTLGLLGESGSGKTTLARAIAWLTPPEEGEVLIGGRPVDAKGARSWLRAELQYVFQDPFGSLDPTKTVGHAIAEPLRIHKRCTKAERPAEVERLLDLVHLPGGHARRRPRELSGGQRQRVAIARALAVRPSVVIADEPTSALDVSTRSEILNLFSDLQDELGISFLFITHDVATARHLAHDIAVMYRGRIVEVGNADDVIDHPRDAYTRRLISAVLEPDPTSRLTREDAVYQTVLD